MKVPFFRVNLSDDSLQAVQTALSSGWLTTGARTREFEGRVADYLGADHAVALNSCTAALHLALEAIGLERGDVVFLPTMTFAATAEVVRYFDATPVFVDMGDDFNIDPAKLEETILAVKAGKPVAGLTPPFGTPKAVIPMHYGGYMCEMDAIMRIAREHNLRVVEDAAHTFPSRYRADESKPWQTAGTVGDIGAYSFYANKCITTGEGGMAVTNDEELANRMRVMSLHGMNRDAWKRYTSQGSWYYEIVAPGFKYNLTDIASSIGLGEMDRVDAYRDRRTEVAMAYNERLGKLDAIQLPPNDPATRFHCWHLYSIRLNLERLSIDRARFIDEMKERGVMCSMHWTPLHQMPYYRDTYGYGDGLFPVAEQAGARQVSLPIFPAQTEDEVDAVCSAIEDIAASFKA